MAVTLLNRLFLLFRPEESPQAPGEQHLTVTSFRMVNLKSPISLKALVWTVLSILIGLGVGQL